jgi:hypothetical protein
MSKARKPYSQMTTAELAEATRKYDAPFGGWDEFKPLTPKDRALHRKARRGRPKVGKGAKRVLVTMERTLLKQADDYAKQAGLSRSQLIAQGVQTILARSA